MSRAESKHVVLLSSAAANTNAIEILFSEGRKADSVQALHAHGAHAERLSGTLSKKVLWAAISPVVESLQRALDASSEATDSWLLRERIYGNASQEGSMEVEEEEMSFLEFLYASSEGAFELYLRSLVMALKGESSLALLQML